MGEGHFLLTWPLAQPPRGGEWDLWPQSSGLFWFLFFFSVQRSRQEARPCGLLPHPASFLGELSIPGNILKGRDESLDLARTLPTRGCPAEQTPPLLGPPDIVGAPGGSC